MRLAEPEASNEMGLLYVSHQISFNEVSVVPAPSLVVRRNCLRKSLVVGF